MNKKTKSNRIETIRVPSEPSKESVYNALNGVTVDWLRRAFGMTGTKVEIKLRGLKPLGETPRGAKLYELKEAAARLVKPTMSLEEYVKDITPDMLPDKLKEAYWNAKLKEQRFMKNAGELWRTESVIAMFGSVLKDVKERAKMITTVAERTMSLTPDQIVQLREVVNDFQAGVYDHIMALEDKTPSSIADLNNTFGIEDSEPDYVSATAIGGDDDFEY